MKFALLTTLPFIISSFALGNVSSISKTNLTEQTILKTDIKESSSTNNSSLNFDSSLGIFRDWTDDEIKEYYSDLDTGVKGDDLLDQLQEIISDGHTQVSYNDAWRSNWYYFKLIDRDYTQSPLTEDEISSQSWSLSDIWIDPLYTEDYYLTSSTSIGTYFNREHMWPKSRGFKYLYEYSSDDDEKPYAGTDMHNLRMGEARNNQSGHNNYLYGNVADKSTATEITDSITGDVTGYRGVNEDGITVYEPRDEDKGDIARALFYMATRYHNFVDVDTNQPALALVNSSSYSNTNDSTSTINTVDTQTSPATYGVLDDLLEWNEEDPVNDFEIHRNNLIYNAVQGNRNPFVDYPEWANVAFGESEYGVNVEAEDGLLREGLDVTADKTTYYDGNILDISSFSFVFYDSNSNSITVDYTDINLTLEIVFNGEVIETAKPASEYVGYIFDGVGTYTLNFSYVNSTGTYTLSLAITVSAKTYVDGLNVVANKNSYYINEALGLNTNFSFYYYDIYGNRTDIVYTDSNLTLGIYKDESTIPLENGVTQASTYNDYIFTSEGTYTLVFEYPIEGETSSYTITLEVTETWFNRIFSEYGIYIVIVAVILIILVIIVGIVVSRKKSKKKSKSKSKKKK